jgi:alanine racemase
MLRDTYAVIDLNALDHNLSLATNEIGIDRIYAVVKANAYGHDLVAFSRALFDRGVRNFAVACLSEALTLYRELKAIVEQCTVLIMGYTSDALLYEYKEYPFVFTIFSIEQAKILNGSSSRVQVEIKVNTGFNRLGKRPTDLFREEVIAIHRLKNISINGIYSHLRLAERDGDLRQIDAFETFCGHLPFKDFRKHICDSIGFIQYPHARFDMVRLGAILYGLVPDRQVNLGYRPVLSLFSEISQIIAVNKGEGISYDEDFSARDDMEVAVIPIGYGDGYKRVLSNQGTVMVNGHMCPIISTICMDQMTVDVTGISAKQGDSVELIGSSISVRTLAAAARTNRNDIVASLSPRIERRFRMNGMIVHIV